MCHSSQVDFTPKTGYNEPLTKITKRLYENNPSYLSDKRNFYWFENDDTQKNIPGHYRNNSASNISSANYDNNK